MSTTKKQVKRYISAETRICDDFGDPFTFEPGEVVYDAVTTCGVWACMTEWSSLKYHKTRGGVRLLGMGYGQKYVRQKNGELHWVAG
jgi:hypothetical protein